jgi:hypothetical protein
MKHQTQQTLQTLIIINQNLQGLESCLPVEIARLKYARLFCSLGPTQIKEAYGKFQRLRKLT